jgi:hypothetical protein
LALGWLALGKRRHGMKGVKRGEELTAKKNGNPSLPLLV